MCPRRPAWRPIAAAVADADGNPAAGAVVVLLPEESNRALRYIAKRVTSDQRGRYQIRGIAQGVYRALALRQLDRETHLAPEFAEQFGEQFAAVTLTDHAQRSLDLTLRRPGR